MKFNSSIISLASQQLRVQAVSFVFGEVGVRFHESLLKAERVIHENKTIKWDGSMVTFVSSDSGKRRFVNRNGCHETCECKSLISYHYSVYLILKQYDILMGKMPLELCKSCHARQSKASGVCWVCEQNQSPYLKKSNVLPIGKLAGVRY